MDPVLLCYALHVTSGNWFHSSMTINSELNQLPEYVVAVDSLESFKKRLDNHMKPWRWAIKASAYPSS